MSSERVRRSVPTRGRFGDVLRFLTAGESHGRALVAVVEGLPAGLGVSSEAIADELARRRLGYGRGPRMRFERDEVTILGGVRHGRTLGSPVAVEIANSEWERGKWNEEMSPEPGETAAALTSVRPGHADLAGMQKYGFTDARDVLERASARETAARVVAGTLAKSLLAELGTSIMSHVVQIGGVHADPDARPGPDELSTVDESQVRCVDPLAEEAMIAEIKAAARDGDSLGGVAEILVHGLPVGLGSYVHWDRKLDGLLAAALMSIHAVKAVEIGDGLSLAARRGSEAHDAIVWNEQEGSYRRVSDRAGGLEGGVSTGELMVARVAMKPLATLNRPVLETVDTATNESTVSFKERTDVTAVPAMGVVAESMVALVLADEALRKFGGDSIAELHRNFDGFGAQVRRQALATSDGPAEQGEMNWDRREAFDDGPEARHTALVGMMGSGKSAVARWVSQQTGRPLHDLDEIVANDAGMSVTELIAGSGEEAFREMEAAALARVVATREPSVIATGGGAVLDPRNRELLSQRAEVVWLRASPEALVTRVGDGRGRPLLGDDVEASLRELAVERDGLYRDLATAVVDTDRLDVAEAGQRVLEATGLVVR